MKILKQSTAMTIAMGPFVDATDGVTAETGLTIAAADVRIKKVSSDFSQSDGSGGTHDENGYYQINLAVADTATVGPLFIAVNASGARQVVSEWFVVPAGVYNALTSTTLVNASSVLTAAGLAAAPTGSTITVSQTAAVGSISNFNLETSQYASPSLPITCSVSQQGDSHKFAIYPLDDFSTPTSTLGSSLCTVGASPYTTVTVALDDAYTASAGVFSYILRNVTDDIDAARGHLRIKPASNLTST